MRRPVGDPSPGPEWTPVIVHDQATRSSSATMHSIRIDRPASARRIAAMCRASPRGPRIGGVPSGGTKTYSWPT